MAKTYKLKKSDLQPGKILSEDELQELLEILNDPNIVETWVIILPDPSEQFAG